MGSPNMDDSFKRMWLMSLMDLRKMVNDITNSASDPSITFVTNFGYVTGEKYELFDVTFDKDPKTEIKGMIDHANLFDLLSLTDSFMAYCLNNNVDVKEKNDMIFLKNVIVQYSNNMLLKIHLDYMVLFIEQIVGVIPGKIELNIKNNIEP